jgi:hypothetical protein
LTLFKMPAHKRQDVETRVDHGQKEIVFHSGNTHEPISCGMPPSGLSG